MEGNSVGRGVHLRPHLEELYVRYNQRAYVCPDPLQFLYGYRNLADREIVALVASALAFGNVKQILRSVSLALERLPEPAAALRGMDRGALRREYRGFKHRYVVGEELADALFGAGRLIERHGSLGACFASGMEAGDKTVMPALERFVAALRRESGERSYLAPSPADGSACKRLHLYLRWMVRQDDVDLGGWDVPASMLIVPLDTHMHRIGRALGLTQRRAADGRTALEVTAAFRALAPEDPVRYDFALTRLGIRTDTDLEGFVRSCGRRWTAPRKDWQKAARTGRARTHKSGN